MTAREHADTAALKARLYAALKHEKSCTCGECSGGLNAVDALAARLREAERERDEARDSNAVFMSGEAYSRALLGSGEDQEPT